MQLLSPPLSCAHHLDPWLFRHCKGEGISADSSRELGKMMGLHQETRERRQYNSHMVGQLLEVVLLLVDLLAELEELLLLAHADGIVLLSLLAALEGVSVSRKDVWLASYSCPFLVVVETWFMERKAYGYS